LNSVLEFGKIIVVGGRSEVKDKERFRIPILCTKETNKLVKTPPIRALHLTTANFFVLLNRI